MTSEHADEIAANLERATQAVEVARKLAAQEYHSFAASRAYYAALCAANAAMLAEGLELNKPDAAVALIHQRLVNPGKLDQEQGRALNWLYELRGIADYGVTTPVPAREAEKAVQAAEDFLKAIRALLPQ